MSGTPLPALPAALPASTVKSRAMGRLQHLGLLPERGSDSPVTMYVQAGNTNGEEQESRGEEDAQS